MACYRILHVVYFQSFVIFLVLSIVAGVLETISVLGHDYPRCFRGIRRQYRAQHSRRIAATCGTFPPGGLAAPCRQLRERESEVETVRHLRIHSYVDVRSLAWWEAARVGNKA